MFKNYLVTALREISKNKIFSAIHILGLALGIAAFVQILQFTLYEKSYDRFYANAGHIYRIRQDRYENGKLSTTWGAGCAAIGPALKNNFPEVISFARLTNVGGIINVEEKSFREEKMFAANTAFLTMFPVPMIAGVDSTALNEPNTAVIAVSIAKKLFGNENAIGQTFLLNKQTPFRVTGVFRDIPENTHLKFDMLISWPTYVKWRGPEIETAWYWDGFYTYIRLRDNTDPATFEKKMDAFTDKQLADSVHDNVHSAKYSLQPLQSIHLHSNLMWEAETNGDYRTVNFLMAIAFIILIIAWVNYINLSTVKAVFRSREVAMRKVSGALRKHLLRQFLTEAFIINAIAALLAFLIVVVTLPYLQTITERHLNLRNIEFWMLFAGVLVVGPILSGIYPALVISSFKPINVIRAKSNGKSGSAFLRKTLVVFQFAASIALIAGTFTVYDQLIYMRNQDLGVNINQTLVLKGPGVTDSTYNQKMTAFKEDLIKYAEIKSITASTSVPGTKVYWNAGGIRRIQDDDSKSNQYRIIGVDYDFIDAYGLSVIKGRNFSKEFSTDESTVLFNQEAVKLMGFDKPESALGEMIYFWGSNYKIIGVVKDFHQESLKENYDALIFRLIPGAREYFSIKLNYPQNAGSDRYKLLHTTLNTVKDHWEKFFPDNPFDYFFLSDQFNSQYHAEKQFRTIFGLFAILAIAIACMGLFGLSWFIIVQRTREIGIRKVNGASVGHILLLVSKDFIRLILLGALVAAPITFYFAKRWLEKYPFRVSFNWALFLLAGIIITTVAALTISYNTFKIAHVDPAESIKYE